MATVYKRRELRPIPDGAEITTYRGKPYAAWTDAKGKARRAPLNAAGNRIAMVAENYTAQFFDENGKRPVVRNPGDRIRVVEAADPASRVT